MNPPVLGLEVIFYWHIIRESHLGRSGSHVNRHAVVRAAQGKQRQPWKYCAARCTHIQGDLARSQLWAKLRSVGARGLNASAKPTHRKHQRPLGRSARGANDKSRTPPQSSQLATWTFISGTTCWSKSGSNPHRIWSAFQWHESFQSSCRSTWSRLWRAVVTRRAWLPNSDPRATPPQCAPPCTCWQVKKHHICKMPNHEKAMTVHFWHSELLAKG